MIIIVLLIIILILVVIIWNLNKKIYYINKLLKNIEEGNFNIRIRMQNCNKNLKKLTVTINNLLDKFQNTYKLNKEYELERKTMITNISHDLRTPVTSLLGYIEVIKSSKHLSEEEKEEYLTIIEHKGNSLRSLMDEFFQLSKLETNDIKLKKEEFNLSELIRQNIILFYNSFNNLNINPIINIPKEDVYILGDKKANERIFNNLISNAIKYGCDGKNIGVDLVCSKNNVKITVWDEGKGIPKDDLSLIFKRLYTLEKSRNRSFQGSGLGLTIVKKLVEMQNGTIIAESIPNKKTKFIVTLPNI
ncbi:HAMP domain-containing histidine kinase [Clostridium niameyense]|uniref:histidine kinase n=1 Tax=Clostridium niameyense TaxID=1622073 RepID=A0A6M0RDF2_9CLOT|nr:HAMP domain-containing sensor histidine kinase [Clostridium niameyense]NEZ47328.1 HAMP domain-containing histidine kinase [Clostridium niameyense]